MLCNKPCPPHLTWAVEADLMQPLWAWIQHNMSRYLLSCLTRAEITHRDNRRRLISKVYCHHKALGDTDGRTDRQTRAGSKCFFIHRIRFIGISTWWKLHGTKASVDDRKTKTKRIIWYLNRSGLYLLTHRSSSLKDNFGWQQFWSYFFFF